MQKEPGLRRASATSGGGLLRMGSAYYGPAIDGRRVEVCPLPVLRDEWIRLHERAGAQNVFLGWEYASTWWDHFKRGREGRVFIARDVSGPPIAIVPLYVEERAHRFGRSRVLANLGQGGGPGPALFDALVLPGREEEVGRAIVLMLENDSSWDYAQLSDIDPEGALARIARAVATASPFELRSEPGREYRSIELDEPFEALVERRGKEFRKEIKQTRRKIERDLRVRIRKAGEELSVASALGLTASLEAARADGKRMPRILAGRHAVSFHEQLAERLERRGELDLSILFSQGSPIAALYGTRRRETYFVHGCVSSPRAERWSPGRYLTSALVERLCGDGVSRILFSEDSPDWSESWADGTRSTVTLQILRPEWRSRSSWVRASLSAPSRSLLRLMIGRDTFEEMLRTWLSARTGESLRAREE